MDREAFCRQSNVLVVAGKGGVGKTTVTATVAKMAADLGLEVLVIELDDAGGLHNLFGRETAFDYAEEVLYERPGGGRVRGRVITPDDALLEYLEEHGLRRVAKRLVAAGVLEVVATAIPGIREILVLGKVKQLERSGNSDLIVLDAPAAGHAVTFLTSALGLMDAARGGPLRTQAQDVVEMLRDPARCQVMLVSLPEETPVNELIESAYRFEDLVGVALAPVVVNSCYPVLTHLETDPVAAASVAGVERPEPERAAQLRAAAAFRIGRQDLQAAQIARLATGLPLPQLQLPYQFTAELGPAQLSALSQALGRAVDALWTDDADR
ncbi:MAG: ArsA-related P-loop ATPase [Acidimicrobiales bacterium]|jgi:anion-transporting  ArsA/GET3 family ATPase